MQISSQSSHPPDNKILIDALQNAILSHENWIEKLREIASSGVLHPIQKMAKNVLSDISTALLTSITP